MPCLPYVYQDQDKEMTCKNSLPLSQFYDYRRRYSPLPDCELNYFDGGCKDFTTPSLPKSLYSTWGNMYKDWRCSEGNCPPDEYEYRKGLFNENKKVMEPKYSHDILHPVKTMFQNPMEPFMNCGVEGSAFLVILLSLLAYLIYDKYFA